MTVGLLRQMLSDLGDTTEVLTLGSDQSYKPAFAHVTTARLLLDSRGGRWYEDFEGMSVLVIG